MTELYHTHKSLFKNLQMRDAGEHRTEPYWRYGEVRSGARNKADEVFGLALESPAEEPPKLRL